MKYPPLPTLLSSLPSTPETIEKIRGIIEELENDILGSENQDRKRIQRLNILTCLKRIKEIEK